MANTEQTPPKKLDMYESHQKIYPRKISGMFRQIKWVTLWVLLGFYYIAPWIRWDRGPNAPDQALLLDVPGRRAYFFFIEIWPQEVYYLTGILILAAIGLFFATALFGRIWCGFACVQTVWTDLFLWVERLVEGDRAKRLRLDQGPLTLSKFFKKIVKHILWLIVSLATGGAWIMYFTDAPTFLVDFFTGNASMTLYSFTAIFAGSTYVLAGWAREQVCIYMCPWPRFQGAMFDEDSLIVTYEEWRGEPRAPARKGENFEDRGHCIDCKQCVQVCPTGVDIRKGQQMACIGCALCVDACNNMMELKGLPKNLITYDSNHNQLAREQGHKTKINLLRPRTWVYLASLGIVLAVMIFSLGTRSRLEVNIIRDRSPLFVMLSDGSIRNGYTYKVLNMERADKNYTLSVEGVPDATMHVIGYSDQGVKSVELPAKPDDVAPFRIFVRAPKKGLDGKSTSMVFVLTDQKTGETNRHDTVFAGPTR